MHALDADAWVDYFKSICAQDDHLLATVRLLPKRKGVEEGGPALEAKALTAIRYDRERDVLQVGVGGTRERPAVRYFIRGPRRIVVEESHDRREIVVDDSSRMRTAISVREAQHAMRARVRATHAAYN